MTGFGELVVAWRGATNPDAPLIVLLHGRGSNEADIITQIGLGGLPFTHTARSIELLATEILPVIRRETGARLSTPSGAATGVP